MPVEMPHVQEFSSWDGVTPFFGGRPEEGRRVYVDKEDRTFLAYGLGASSPRIIFKVSGTLPDELGRFLAQVVREGAQVLEGMPPIETKNGGDRPPPPPGTPVGIKSDETAAPSGAKSSGSKKDSKPVSR